MSKYLLCQRSLRRCWNGENKGIKGFLTKEKKTSLRKEGRRKFKDHLLWV